MSKKSEKVDLDAMRHSLAHILATAVQELYPGVKFGIGPVIDNGFYYDFNLDVTLSPDDLPKIEAKMRKIVKANQKFERRELSISDAIRHFEGLKQPYKVELLHDLEKHGTTVMSEIENGEKSSGEDEKITTVSLYSNGPFTDLCRGGHLESTGQVGAFKLQKVSGAYWRGDQANPQMQRVYGLAFATDAELNKYVSQLEEAEKRDHRKLGREMDLFISSDLVGSGLPLWTPRGTVMRRQIDNFIQELRSKYGYEEVTIPHITKKDLYEKSGHWKKFSDELFRITTREGHEFAMKPMNCPHHAQIYASRPRSYRDLPVRYRETTMVYRDEQSGELGGLSRVRSITQDDAHVFCRNNQIKGEIESLWDIIHTFYGVFEIPLKVRFSTHDPSQLDAYSGTEKDWQSAEKQLAQILKAKVGDDYMKGVGEAAFYGPKLDFIGQDALGREHQVATVQLDFNQPEGFDLSCINEKGEEERIVMIHCAVAGSLERFMALMIEHYAGNFPVWLAPEQVRIATVNDDKKIAKKAEQMCADLKAAGIRVQLDAANESVGKKIREATLQKVPYTIVVGEKEVASGKVTPRVRADLGKDASVKFEKFVELVAQEVAERASKSSL